jgi:hypothetical protein
MDDLLGILSINPLTEKFDGSLIGLVFQKSHNRFEDRGLSCAVGSQDGNDLPFLNLQGDPPDRHDEPIKGLDVFYFKQSFTYEGKIKTRSWVKITGPSGRKIDDERRTMNNELFIVRCLTFIVIISKQPFPPHPGRP